VPRILLTTRCRDSGLYDYFRENAPRNFRWRFGMPRKISFGLRFLKQNIPGLTIAEYPTRSEYSELLKRGWDAVGFSFYLEETNDILSMAEEAQRAGVAQLWAGNYGALTSSIHSHFDHVFTSYSEQELAGLLGTTIDEIQHPPLVTEFRLPGGWSLPVGVLFLRVVAASVALSVRPRRSRRTRKTSASNPSIGCCASMSGMACISC
jgi:hypothetical protein